jgi:3-hydroxyisobutyrate dehydrogenase-like beta-hydroxyacid dehydrogenase
MGDTVAVVGLGQMGRAMARRLVQTGFALRVWNRTRPASDAVPNATVCASAREAATGARFVLTSLADDTAVREVVLGPDGVLDGMDAEAIHVGASTISHRLAGALAEAHAGRGRRFVAAPVLGRPDAAEAGQLWILTGGDAEVIARCQPLFVALGQGQKHLGDPARAMLGKICVNFVTAGLIELLGEASALAEKGGIPPAHLMQLFTGTLLGAPVMKTYGARIAAGDYSNAGFRMPLGLKDLDLALASGEELRVPLPVGDVVHGHMLEALAHGREGWDWSAIAAVAREAAGLRAEGA